MKFKVLICLICILLLNGCGKNFITQKDFEKGINNFLESEANYAQCQIKLNSKKMLITYSDWDYELSYNLTGKPTITYEFEIEKGISYYDYYIRDSTLDLTSLAYFAIADHYGVNALDSYSYFISTYMKGMNDAIYKNKVPYKIIGDDESYDSDDKVIFVSEFEDKVIEYIKDTYNDVIIIKDEKYDTFTYKLKTKCDSDSCKITTKLTVNPEGNFNGLVGYIDEYAKSFMDQSITPENACYNIELKVGETLSVTGKDLTGYSMSGMSIVDNEDIDSGYLFKATQKGIANGEFHIGQSDFRSFYITVTEANDNILENKTLIVE